MGDGTEQNPYTRDDVQKLIRKNGGTAKGLNLSWKIFEGAIDLSGLDLHGIILMEAKFPTSFKRDMVEGADLSGTNLEKADLTKAHLEGADLRDTHLEGANLRDTHLEGARLWDTHLEGANLMRTHLQGTDLMRTKLSLDVGLENVDWGNYILGEETDGSFDVAVDTYRQLKAWYAQSGYHDTAARFYYREKEAFRKSLKLFSKSWNHRLTLELMRALFGYGEDWKRVLYWMASVVLGSTAAYWLFGELDLLYSLYFSVISFTALGYGKWVEIVPQGWVQALGAFQSFTGVFMMALLLVTFVRKWTR